MSNVDNAYRFAAKLQEWAGEKYPAVALAVSQVFAWQAVEKLILKTRWDTGHARFNWQANYSGPAVGEIPGGDPSGINTILRERARILAGQPFQNVHISNPVPYGPMLEGLDGMVSSTVAELRAEAKAIGLNGYSRWKATNG